MKPDIVKICGLSTPGTVEAVMDGAATHLGMIFFEKSPRHLDLETAKELSAISHDRILRVAVTVNADDEYLDSIINTVKPELLQLHGSESVERTLQLKARYGLPVIKALAVHGPDDLENARAYTGVADHFLFDAKAPAGSEIPGGNGVAFDWEIMDLWPKDVPYILSGGLNAENIGEALSRSGTKGIDVSSGVETAPGKKDVALISDFLALVT